MCQIYRVNKLPNMDFKQYYGVLSPVKNALIILSPLGKEIWKVMGELSVFRKLDVCK